MLKVLLFLETIISLGPYQGFSILKEPFWQRISLSLEQEVLIEIKDTLKSFLKQFCLARVSLGFFHEHLWLVRV